MLNGSIMKTKEQKTSGKKSNNSPFVNTQKGTGFFGVQTKLSIGKPGDKYEKEADQVADKVVQNSSENQGFFGDSGFFSPSRHSNNIQEKPLAETISPLVQCQEEEEELQMRHVQRQEEEEELQMQPMEEEEEMLQTQQEEEEIQASGEEPTSAKVPIENKLNENTGEGRKMDSSTRSEMEAGFGTDFGNVNIHTGSAAVQMSQQLGAHAFTHGNNIYFNNGKYNPKSRQGKHLLAHELTHTLQQSGGLQRKRITGNIQSTSLNIQGGFWGDVWEGVKSVGRTVVGGVKSAGQAIWSGVKAVAGYSWNVLKSAGAWVWDLVTEAPSRIWRILKHIGSGILGTLSWVWDGIKGALGHIWEAAKGVFAWIKGGVKGLFTWIWQGLRGGANWAYRLLKGDFSGFWEGIGNAFKWLGNGVVSLAKWGWEGLKGAAIWAWQGVVGVAKWIGRGFLKGLAWAGRMIAKLLDLVGFGEIMDLIFNIVKFNTRTLTSTEKAEAEKVFRGSVSLWQVRIDEASLISAIGSFFSGGGGMGVTLFHTVNFNRKINSAAGNSDMAWLIHELTHVSQYEHVGSQYIGEAIHSQATVGYDYGKGAGLAGKDFKDFNREQQGDIIKHYYYYILCGNNDPDYSNYATDYNRMIAQARNGEF